MCSRWARMIATVTLTSPCLMPSSARRQRSIFSVSGTAKGSRSSGVRYSPVCASTGARFVWCRPGAARANSTARSAESRAPVSSSRPAPANPQAPSTSTRTPMPSLSVSLRSSTWPFFVITYWRRSETARASAYDAPAPSAASTAASARAFTEPTLTRPGSDPFTSRRSQPPGHQRCGSEVRVLFEFRAPSESGSGPATVPATIRVARWWRNW